MKRLVTDGTQWLVSFREDAEAEEVFGLFGTYEIPTPYLVFFPRAQVVAALARIGTIVE